MASVPPPPVWSTQAATAIVPSGAIGSPGGFWRRLIASLIDGVILIVPILMAVGILSLATGDIAAFNSGEADAAAAIVVILWMMLAFGTVVVVSWLYEALMTSSARGATLGKQALGMRIVRADGTRLSFGRATARYFLKTLITPLLPFGIGYLLAAFTAGKRALHDFMADALVIGSR